MLIRSAASRLSFHARLVPVEERVGGDDVESIALAGRGAFAEVWKVRDRRTGRLFARKQLLPDWQAKPVGLRLLENEAEVTAAVSSEFIVPLHDAHLDSRPPYLLFAWLSGTTLEEVLQRERLLPWCDAIWIARQCAQGMHDLLIHGYLHGDIKPANIFICDDGAARLIDFGFARRDSSCSSGADTIENNSLAGTPEYMAPELLVSGQPASISRDIYSLGVTLYRMLAGRLPFQGDHPAEIMRHQRDHVPKSLRSLAPHVPMEVVSLVQRLLSKQPIRRGGGLHWLIRELIGLELNALRTENND